jgi:ribonuclease HI
MTPNSIYCDGGVVGPNPSAIGGTWCWCWVTNGKILRYASGVVTPETIGVDGITNNVTELYAALRALESVPRDWAGTLFSDSKCTLMRLTNCRKWRGVPDWLRVRVQKRRAGRKYVTGLLGGHPTQAELKRGLGKRGHPVSEFNVFCDKECTRLARAFKTATRSQHNREEVA